jgi:hypothetical protein
MKLRFSMLLLLLALSAAPAFGQCAMCYSSAKGASNGGQTAITRGVLTLLLPPISMMMGLVGFAFRYNRNGQRGSTDLAVMTEPAAESRVSREE